VSILRLRAIVKIQPEAPVVAGSNCEAFRHTASKVSCANSSAAASEAPERRMKVFTRGAKCSKSIANASRSCRTETASISRAQSAGAVT
jgi:hypothetical protein